MLSLSILRNAYPGSTTYYSGDDPSQVAHLKDCVLLCNMEFDGLEGVEQRVVDDPQLEFYRLSQLVEDEYTFVGLEKDPPVIGQSVTIGPGVVLGRGVVLEDHVEVGANSVIYAKTVVKRGARIDPNCTIGTAGMMWAWDHGRKVYLRQLGGVRIGEECVIGSNCAIVRGSANELTILEDCVNMAPGCCIGHGSYLGSNVHLANNVTLGGSVWIARNSFVGCAAVLKPGVRVRAENVVIAQEPRSLQPSRTAASTSVVQLDV